LELARNALSLTSARLASKGLAFVVGVLVARHLGADSYGEYNVIMAFVLIFSFVGDFGMVSLLIREVAATPDHTPQLLSDGVSAQIAVSATAVSTLLIVGFFLEPSSLIRYGLVLGAAALGLESMGRPFTAVIIGSGKIAVAALLLAVVSMTNTALLLVTLLTSRNVLALVAAGIPVAVVSALLPIGVVMRSGTRAWLRTSHHSVSALLLAAAPFALLAGSAVLYDRIDVLMLSWMDTSHAVGVFSAADRVIEGLLVIPAGIGAALYPVMSANVDTAARRLRSTARWSVPLCAAVAALCIFPGAVIVSFLFGGQYQGIADTFRLLAPAVFLGALTVPLGYLLQARRRTGTAVLATMVGLVTDLGLDLLLIPRYSTCGAALSATLAEGVVLVTLLIAVAAQSEGPDHDHRRRHLSVRASHIGAHA
jgi:O-antigen/teichoic acid export membrane protein